MDNIEIMNRLQEVFCDVIGRDDIKLKQTDTSTDIPGWDSVAHVNILVAVQNEFNIDFDMDEITALHSVGDMVLIIAQKNP